MEDQNQPTAPQTPKSPRFPLFLALLSFLLLLFSLYLSYRNMQLTKQIAELSKPTPSPTPTITTDPTADWKTYTNTQYGFSFQYPSHWQDNQSDALFSLSDQSGHGLSGWIVEVLTGGDFFASETETQMSISGKPARVQYGSYIKNTSANTARIFIPLKVSEEIFMELTFPSNEISSAKTLLQQTLSTFKFLPKD